MQENLKVEVQATGPTLNLKFIGSISETSKFPEMSLEKITEISLDFGDVTYINSAGVRHWIKWMWHFEKEKDGLSFSIRRCSPRIVRQIHAINSFVPKSTSITSFLIPYECDNCSHSFEKLFNVEPSFKTNLATLKAVLNETVLCPKCGSKMELDAIPEDYFVLIQNRP